jgi:fructose-1-phosphate kinase PfkB-like protein
MYMAVVHTQGVSMGKLNLTYPRRVAVKRSELRQHQRATLKRAKGRTVVVIAGSDEEEEKLVVDKDYFEELIRELRAAGETLAITMDKKLFSQILRAADTLDEDIRLGKLRSFEEAFGEE